MLNKQQISITAIVAVVVGTGAAATTVKTWWPHIGWTTPSQHQADIANQQIAVGILSDQIRCRRWEVELDALYAQVNEGDSSRRLSDRIRDHRTTMDQSRCQRFSSY